ncbi:HD domain-containing protein [Nocardia colli]|uniref:phosphohydrolase n=1 Tax=Nocardia colli TaxID=2545717 RepID=UPI00168D47CB|nr:phosphohydrolase [Nocardia colli]
MTTGIDLDWATRTSGALSSKQRRQLMATVTRSLPALLADRARLAAGRRGAGRLDLAGLRLPDSTLARAAETEAHESLSIHVLAHSYRTYFFGRVLADLDGACYDDELVYVSCLLHDLNLEHPTPGSCFAVTGAERAARFVSAAGATPDRTQAIATAITTHITPGNGNDDLSIPGRFIYAGASADVIGARISELDPTWVNELLELHPRHNFTKHMITAMTNEAKAMPQGRTRWLNTHTGLLQLIRFAPFAE